MIKVEIYGVSFDLVGQQPVILLKTEEGNKFLPIWVGHPEAAAILMRLQDAEAPRPMTHDLALEMVIQLGGKITKVEITDLQEGTFFAQVVVQQNGDDLVIDSRPSDALALAVRAEVPIFIADDIIEEQAVEFEPGEVPGEEQMISEFKKFLENVTPEEFARGDEPNQEDEPEPDVGPELGD
jgi:bifunctional DNase/RNase